MVRNIQEFPFVAYLERAGGYPLLLSDMLPGIDLAIFRRAPAAHSFTDDELRQVALQVIEEAVEDEGRPGVWIKEMMGATLFSWRAVHRPAVLAALGIRELISKSH